MLPGIEMGFSGRITTILSPPFTLTLHLLSPPSLELMFLINQSRTSTLDLSQAHPFSQILREKSYVFGCLYSAVPDGFVFQKLETLFWS